MRRSMVRLFRRLGLVLLVLLPGLHAARLVYAIAERCFPETGQCIDGRFRQFWEVNGG